MDGVLIASETAVSIEDRDAVVVALEDATETATEATRRAFLAQLSTTQRELLAEILDTAMVEAQQATLLLLTLVVLLMLLSTTLLPREMPESSER